MSIHNLKEILGLFLFRRPFSSLKGPNSNVVLVLVVVVVRAKPLVARERQVVARQNVKVRLADPRHLKKTKKGKCKQTDDLETFPQTWCFFCC
jgi:hypothetical protein